MPREARRTAPKSTSFKADTIPAIPASSVATAIALYKPLVQAVAATIGPHCEVVLHDLRNPERSIVAISNGSVTGRSVGGPVIGGPAKDVALQILDSGVRQSTLSVGYKTRLPDGRELRSTTLILRSAGRPAIAFCINVDLSALTMAKLLLEEISKVPQTNGSAPAGPPQRSMTDIVADIIGEALKEVGRPPKFMSRDDRLRITSFMHERGLFLIRGGVERAAAALEISKFTLYSYLKQVRATGTTA